MIARLERPERTTAAPDGPKRASALGNGIYKPEAPFLNTGHVDLIVTVIRGETNDVLPVTIDIPVAPNADDPKGAARLRALWLSPAATGILGFILGATLIALLRRRRSAMAAMVVMAAAFLAVGEARA